MELFETLADHQCWNFNEMSQYHYGVDAIDASAIQQDSIMNTFFNIMSYHGNRSILTPMQFDRWQTTVNDFQTRRDVICNNYFMQEFYLDLEDPNWTNSANWIDRCNFCTWKALLAKSFVSVNPTFNVDLGQIFEIRMGCPYQNE